MDDIEVIWVRNPSALVRRFQALADEFDNFGMGLPADLVRSVLACEYNPLPDKLPELGVPPARNSNRGRGLVPEPGS